LDKLNGLEQIRAIALDAAARIYAGKFSSGNTFYTDDDVIESAKRYERYLRGGR